MSEDRRLQPILTGLALSRNTIDRADPDRADPQALGVLWAAESTRVLVLSGEYAVVSGGALRLIASASVEESEVGERFFLGMSPNGYAIFAVVLAEPRRLEGGTTLREVGAQLSDEDSEIFATAVALANWHKAHQRCPRCGEPTYAIRGGWVRQCPADNSEHFPRTDPAIIVLVRDPQDRALLGRRSTWPPGWFSTLAGFVEPGESLENAVVREVMEEASITLTATDVQYLGSQPWPFPASIMLGFHAYTQDSGDPVGDGEEIAEARWFSRDELATLCESGEVKIPPAVSIARHLIERWYGSELPGDWSRP